MSFFKLDSVGHSSSGAFAVRKSSASKPAAVKKSAPKPAAHHGDVPGSDLDEAQFTKF